MPQVADGPNHRPERVKHAHNTSTSTDQTQRHPSKANPVKNVGSMIDLKLALEFPLYVLIHKRLGLDLPQICQRSAHHGLHVLGQ